MMGLPGSGLPWSCLRGHMFEFITSLLTTQKSLLFTQIT